MTEETWEVMRGLDAQGHYAAGIVLNGLPTPDPRWRIVAKCDLLADADRIVSDHNALHEALEALREVAKLAEHDHCIWCGGIEDRKHHPDCPIAKATAILNKQGG